MRLWINLRSLICLDHVWPCQVDPYTWKPLVLVVVGAALRHIYGPQHLSSPQGQPAVDAHLHMPRHHQKVITKQIVSMRLRDLQVAAMCAAGESRTVNIVDNLLAYLECPKSPLAPKLSVHCLIQTLIPWSILLEVGATVHDSILQ